MITVEVDESTALDHMLREAEAFASNFEVIVAQHISQVADEADRLMPQSSALSSGPDDGVAEGLNIKASVQGIFSLKSKASTHYRKAARRFGKKVDRYATPAGTSLHFSGLNRRGTEALNCKAALLASFRQI